MNALEYTGKCSIIYKKKWMVLCSQTEYLLE